MSLPPLPEFRDWRLAKYGDQELAAKYAEHPHLIVRELCVRLRRYPDIEEDLEALKELHEDTMKQNKDLLEKLDSEGRYNELTERIADLEHKLAGEDDL